MTNVKTKVFNSVEYRQLGVLEAEIDRDDANTISEILADPFVSGIGPLFWTMEVPQEDGSVILDVWIVNHADPKVEKLAIAIVKSTKALILGDPVFYQDPQDYINALLATTSKDGSLVHTGHSVHLQANVILNESEAVPGGTISNVVMQFDLDKFTFEQDPADTTMYSAFDISYRVNERFAIDANEGIRIKFENGIILKMTSVEITLDDLDLLFGDSPTMQLVKYTKNQEPLCVN